MDDNADTQENECDDQNGHNSSNGDTSMPWALFNAHFDFVRQKDQNNFETRCKACPPNAKLISCAFSSRNNLKSHLKRKHNWTEEQLKELNVRPLKLAKLSKKGGGDGESSTESKPFDSNFSLKKKITQEEVNKAVDEFVIFTNQPHRVVDSPYFKKLVLLGLPPSLTVSCRQTFRKRMDQNYEVMLANLTKHLETIDHIATVADGWSKYGRGFLGMVATWLNPTTLDREFAGLALQRLKGRHTLDPIGSAMISVHARFKINDKVTRCITDSAVNFDKDVKVLGSLNLQLETEADSDELDEDEDYEPLADDEECALLDLDDMMTDPGVGVGCLPPHHRCASHILNLIETSAAKEALDTNAAYKKVHDSTNDKLREWWRQQNRSNLVAKTILSGFGVKLQVPGDTWWKSEFDAKVQIVQLFEKDEDMFTETLENAGLPKLLSSEIRFLKEFVWVMAPVALALDILQRDKNMFIGFLLPTVASMERNMLQKCTRLLDGKPLKHCDALIRTLMAALRKPRRFEQYKENLDLEIAACLLPCFKLDWIEDASWRSFIKQAILDEMKKLGEQAPSAAPLNFKPETTNSEDEDESASTSVLISEDKFFGFGFAVSPPSGQTKPESAEDELDRYLNKVNRSWTVADCYAVKSRSGKREFPTLYKLFLKFNTAVPSSAAVERFFSLAGLSYTSLRNVMGGDTLEKEVLLNLNRRFWSL